MFKTLLEQFPNENSGSEFFSFQDVLKEVMFKTLLEQFHVKTHVLNTFSISRCSERSDVPNTLGTISIWKLTFWTLFPFQDVLEEVMFQTLLEQIPHENSRFEHFFHFKMFWKKWCPTHFSNTYDVKTLFWTLFPFQDVLTEVMFQALLRHFSCENSRFEHFFSFQDVLTELVFRTPFEQFQYESSRFEHFFDFKIFWKNWCPKHFSNNYHVKTLFWTLFAFQDVLTEVMFQALLLQFSHENSHFEHFFHFKMFWKK